MREDYSCVAGSSPCSKVSTLKSVSELSKWWKISKMDKIQCSHDWPFPETILIFRNIRENKKYDAKNRLSIPGPSPEKHVTEIIPLKIPKFSLPRFIKKYGFWITNFLSRRANPKYGPYKSNCFWNGTNDQYRCSLMLICTGPVIPVNQVRMALTCTRRSVS